MKNKIKSFCDKVYNNFRGINVSEDDIEYQSSIVVSIHSLLVCDKKYLFNSIFRQL